MRIEHAALAILVAALFGPLASCSEDDGAATGRSEDEVASEEEGAARDNNSNARDASARARDASASTRGAGRGEASEDDPMARDDASADRSDEGESRKDAGAQAESRADASKQAADGSTSAAADDAGANGSYSPCPSNGDPCKILPLGDSITYGLGPPNPTTSGSYRVELFKKALAANQHITFVGSVQTGPAMVNGVSFPKNNEGHSGFTISQLAGRVPTPALQSKPNIVLLMAGTNDMYISPGPADAPKRLGDLIDKLAAADPNMFLVVAKVTPLGNYADAVKTFNAALPAIVETRAKAGKHVVLVDMHSGFPQGQLADGVHPTQAGYDWMAGVWYEAIKGLLH